MSYFVKAFLHNKSSVKSLYFNILSKTLIKAEKAFHSKYRKVSFVDAASGEMRYVLDSSRSTNDTSLWDVANRENISTVIIALPVPKYASDQCLISTPAMILQGCR